MKTKDRNLNLKPKSYGQGGFGSWRAWALAESEWMNEMQNPFGTFSDISFTLIYKQTCGVCVRARTQNSVGNQYTHSPSHR